MASASFIFISFVTIFLFPLCTFSQSNGVVNVGTSLTATETSTPWLSPSGDFAFGFQKLRDNDRFLLSIWYNKIPAKTIVWYPTAINQAEISQVLRGSTVRIEAQNGLVLRDPQGRQLWRSDNIVDNVSYGLMNDTGNFVIYRRDSVSLWESFNNPSDTILPTQKIEINSKLVSRKSATNFTRGRFYLRMLNDGNLVLSTRTLRRNLGDFDYNYYSSETSDSANASRSGNRVVFNERGFIYVSRRNGERRDLTTSRSMPTTWDYYHRAILRFDGVFRQYHHPKNFSGNPGWTSGEFWPENICTSILGDLGSGACGFNSICRLVNGEPICGCPKGYSLADPNDPYSNCYPNFFPNCGQDDRNNSAKDYQMVEVSDTDWPTGDFEEVSPCDEDCCKEACLNDCLCAVSIYKDNHCWKKKHPLSFGRLDTGANVNSFLKLRNVDVPSESLRPIPPTSQEKSKNDRGTLILVISVLLGSSVFVNFMLLGVVCFGFILIFNKKITSYHPSAAGVNLRPYTFNELVKATNGFKEELGRGAFGIVYKGVMTINGYQTTIAVKKLDRVAQDTEKEFRTEVNVIGQTHHKNLVRLLGFCDEGPNRLLVYEYMNNGTVASFLFGDLKPNWNQRTQIAIGVARGLAYLHEECNTQIIHCDIKPQNILLDEYYNARISDFGLAKLLMMNQSRTVTNIRGTKGYVAPEWFRNTQVTAKVDVYSFGVLLLEIITCRRSVEDLEFGEGENPILTEWVWDCFVEGRLDTLVGYDSEALDDKKKLQRFVMVGIWCVQEDVSSRPTMRKVSQMLEGILEVKMPSCPSPSFS